MMEILTYVLVFVAAFWLGALFESRYYILKKRDKASDSIDTEVEAKQSHASYIPQSNNAVSLDSPQAYADTPMQQVQTQKKVPVISAQKQPSEIDAIVREGYQSIAEMRRVESFAQNKTVKAKIHKMTESADLIFKQLKKTPEKFDSVRKFMTEFLPTTMRVLNIYAELVRNNVQGANINKTKRQVESMIGDISSAFERQLDAMYHSEAMDVSADISMLDSFMRREGLAGDEIHDLIMGYSPRVDETIVDDYTDDISGDTKAKLVNGKFVQMG